MENRTGYVDVKVHLIELFDFLLRGFYFSDSVLLNMHVL